MDRKTIRYFVLISLMVWIKSTYAYSYPSYYCEKTFKTISIGANMDAAQTACGEPTSNTVKQVQVQTPVNTVQWVYTLGIVSINGVTLNLPSLAITFSDNKVIEIERNGFPISAGGRCAINGVVNIGDNINSVLMVCGNPNLINQRQIAKTTTKQVTEWVYNFGPYRPQVIFDFENGVLTQINVGQLGN